MMRVRREEECGGERVEVEWRGAETCVGVQLSSGCAVFSVH